MKIRTLIVDDELLGRERLRQLLETEPSIEIMGVCADGRSAVRAIRNDPPDLLFLDVQMPELDGFGVLQEISGENMPAIIFVTAHDKFALRAFEVHAVDYLLKPFDRERFYKALSRVINLIKDRQGSEIFERQAALIAELKTPPKFADRIAVKSGGFSIVVQVDEIDWIGSADNYAELHLGSRSHLLRETLSALENRLDPQKFVRISRSSMINATRIKELKRLFYGGYEITLQNGVVLTLSRGYREKLKQLGLG